MLFQIYSWLDSPRDFFLQQSWEAPWGLWLLLTAGRETTTAWSEKLHSLASFCILQTCEGMNAARILRDHKHPLQFNSAALQLQHTKACTPRAAFRGSQRNRIRPNPLEMKWQRFRRFEHFGRPGRCTLTALRRGWLLPRSRRNFDSGSRCLAWQQLCRFAALPRNAKYWNSKNAFP